ncbi:MAG TPA: lysophospholipid acyltransferase family protein [Pyrinomonadaceae bacterium]|nr:lysophospholipid acyltransferase family protein [Pyrinomonadaceae bacterium]
MANPGKIQTWLEYATARSVLGVLSAIPARWALAVGEAMGSIAHTLAADLRRTGERNLLLAFPEKSDQERQEILAGCFRNLGRQLGFFSHLSSDSREQLLSLIDYEGLEIVERTKAEGTGTGDGRRGLILFTGHVGAWELTSFGLSLVGHPFSFLVRRLDNPRVEELVDRIRTRFGNQSVDKRGAARPMLKLLKSGGTLGLLIDLNTLDDEAIFVDFFGVPAATTFMLAKLALRTDALVIPLYAPWDQRRKKFVFHALPPIAIERSGDEEEDVRRLTAALSRSVEDFVRKYPEQWLWIHKRWKTRPPGEAPIY